MSKKKPDFWCDNCEIKFYAHEAREVRERDPYATGDTSYVVSYYHCPDCDTELDDYDSQGDAT